MIFKRTLTISAALKILKMPDAIALQTLHLFSRVVLLVGKKKLEHQMAMTLSIVYTYLCACVHIYLCAYVFMFLEVEVEVEVEVEAEAEV